MRDLVCIVILPPGPPSLPPGAAGARSFNPEELSDSSEDELFITPAPPDYDDVIG